MCYDDCYICGKLDCNERTNIKNESKKIDNTSLSEKFPFKDVAFDSKYFDEARSKEIESTKKSLLLYKQLEADRMAMHEFVDNHFKK
jgi:hypothetical protein